MVTFFIQKVTKLFFLHMKSYKSVYFRRESKIPCFFHLKKINNLKFFWFLVFLCLLCIPVRLLTILLLPFVTDIPLNVFVMYYCTVYCSISDFTLDFFETLVAYTLMSIGAHLPPIPLLYAYQNMIQIN